MTLRPLHRWPFAWRVAALLAFAACVVARPMLSAWGEMHEFVTHADTGSAHPHDDATHMQGAGDASQGDPVDQLLHHAHCCGPSTGLIDIHAVLPGVPFVSAWPPPGVVPDTRAARLASPFRPPIRG